ncbi:MAG TPA: hypothetical protein VEI46_00335, partial [Thermodesulfovibrionales bacterium]|nr:hypothetical protein [Thermodesulfovibrionales bacterium]
MDLRTHLLFSPVASEAWLFYCNGLHITEELTAGLIYYFRIADRIISSLFDARFSKSRRTFCSQASGIPRRGLRTFMPTRETLHPVSCDILLAI